MPTVVPADALAVEELAALWNRAYADYFVPLAQTPASMARHLEAGSIDLTRSMLLRDAGEFVALSLLGVRGSEGWIGGFGVVPERRRGGLSGRLLAAQVAAADAAGLARVRLEVLVQNWARRAYERAGFRETRRLGVLGGTVAAPRPSPRVVGTSLEEALAAAAALPSPPRCWQREPTSLRPVADVLHAFVRLAAPAPADGGAGAAERRPPRAVDAVLIVERTEAKALRMHEAAGDAAALAELARHATHALATERLLLVNEPEGTAADRAMRALGCAEIQAQWEMERLAPAAA